MIKAHRKNISAVTELETPFLVASSSLDGILIFFLKKLGKIKLWDFSVRSKPVLATELKDPSDDMHGIRGLTYSSCYGSNLLSFGF